MKTPRYGWTASLVLLGLALPVGAQTFDSNWIMVAHHVGGSGHSGDGRYARLVPVTGWGTKDGPPAWVEFHWGGEVLGSIPLPRDRVDGGVKALKATMPFNVRIKVANTFGRRDPRVHLRFRARGRPRDLGRAVRRVFDRLEPGALAVVTGTAVTKKDSFECEPVWSFVVDGSRERLAFPGLPEPLRKDGVRVRFEARRRESGRPDDFSYMGVKDYWWTHAKLLSFEVLPGTASPPARSTPTPREWTRRCRADARARLKDGSWRRPRRARRLATGFEEMHDPGRLVCPDCRRLMDRDWLFRAADDRVEATLFDCPAHGHYYFLRDGHVHGPFRPGDGKERR